MVPAPATPAPRCRRRRRSAAVARPRRRRARSRRGPRETRPPWKPWPAVFRSGYLAYNLPAMDGGEGARDDRILPLTRWAALAVFCILVPAWVVLFCFPGETADAWAWTITPDLTPIFMGAGYGAGAYFFFRTFRGEGWHPSSVGILSAAAFAILMLAATLIHWDKFNHGDAPTLGAIAFYGWVGIYIAAPFALLALWIANRRTDPGEPAVGEPLVPELVRLAAAGFSIVGLAI